MQVRAEEWPESESEAEDLLALLEAQIPEKPALPAPETVALIYRVGATKRLDAALVLVRALAFSFNPIGQSESRSAFGSMPAAETLKANFGTQVLPILMFKGLTAKEGWLQTRLALTIREIGTVEDIEELRESFSLDKSKDPVAKEFSVRLVQKYLSFADDPVLLQFDELRKLYEELLERKREKSEKKPKPPLRGGGRPPISSPWLRAGLSNPPQK